MIMMEKELTVNQLSFYYGKHKALDNLNITFKPGIYGLIGPNGAGKSTLIRLISGLLLSEENKIKYGGVSIQKLGKSYRSLIGLMPQNQQGYEEYTGYSFLHYMAVLKEIPKDDATNQIKQLVNEMDLNDSIHNKIKTYSGGMRQRLMFAQSILGNPKILILDEPTAGLDPSQRIKLRNYISAIAENKIVIIATHVMQDVESIADELILIDQGKLIFKDTNEALLDTLKGKVFEITLNTKKDLEDFHRKYRVSRVYKFEDKYKVRYIDPNNTNGFLTPIFEDVYLYYMVKQDVD